MSLEAIEALSKQMEHESRAIKSELYRMCWFMRGGMSVTEAYTTSEEDRKIITALIEKNIETTRETQWPFF